MTLLGGTKLPDGQYAADENHSERAERQEGSCSWHLDERSAPEHDEGHHCKECSGHGQRCWTRRSVAPVLRRPRCHRKQRDRDDPMGVHRRSDVVGVIGTMRQESGITNREDNSAENKHERCRSRTIPSRSKPTNDKG